jgi:hypothetical protein
LRGGEKSGSVGEMQHPITQHMLYSPCLGAMPLAREIVGGRACPVRPVISALRVFGVFGAPGRFLFSKAEKLKTEKLKWIAAALVCLGLGGCTPIAEFARGYDRELVAGHRGGKNFVEYRISRGSSAESRELVAMVVQLLDELNAGKLPVSEKVGSGGASPSKEVIK